MDSTSPSKPISELFHAILKWVVQWLIFVNFNWTIISTKIILHYNHLDQMERDIDRYCKRITVAKK